MYILEHHPEDFGDKRENFSLSIIRSTRPNDLERAEDYVIWRTRADIIGLNRNKPIK